MVKKRYIIWCIIGILLFATSCRQQKLLKSSDNNLKYESAIAYFNKKDYYRALQLFDQLNTIFRGTTRGERINFYQAYCYYEQNDYTLAGYYFQRFAKNYPTSKDAEEALFMSALCKYNLSPRYSLDQTNTDEALTEFQTFLNRYPNTERKEECNKYIDLLRAKLAKKDFEVAKLFLKMDEFESAIVCFNNVIKNHPTSPYIEDAAFYILRSYYQFAFNSINEKKLERFQKTLDSYNDFVSFYPNSVHKKEAEKMNALTLENIEKINNNNNK
jgi:outer membrane protein assembly factor BamD